MKRSRINQIMAEADEMIRQYGFTLPPFAYWTPEEFDELGAFGDELGFTHVASGPLVRSSYHADEMAGKSGLFGVSGDTDG